MHEHADVCIFMHMVSVAVAGASGYAGGELLRLLLAHPEVEIGALTANSSAGNRLAAHQPHLVPLADREILPTNLEVLREHEVVFLALPHGASAGMAAELGDAAVVVDIAADHRLVDGASWQQFYGSEHPGTWPYGLPELPLRDGSRQREHLIRSQRIATPGCYPTAVSLALAPGFAAGLLEPDDVVVVAASGTSGAGKALKPHLLAAEVMGAMSPYGVGGSHRHIPEMEQNLGWAAGEQVSLSFTPTLAPMPRGILATCTARVAPGVTTPQLRRAWQEAYAGEPFVSVLPEGSWPSTAMTLGANTVVMQLAHDEHTGRVVVVAAVDNLTKGTAGAAIQCMNLCLGLPEGTGLPLAAVAP